MAGRNGVCGLRNTSTTSSCYAQACAQCFLWLLLMLDSNIYATSVTLCAAVDDLFDFDVYDEEPDTGLRWMGSIVKELRFLCFAVRSTRLHYTRLAPVLRNPQTSLRPQGVNIISKVVNLPNGCYAQYIRGSILSLPLFIYS